MNKNVLLVLIIRAIPYPQQIEDIELEKDTEAVRFTWRGTRFRVGQNLMVEEVKDGMLSGSDMAILLGHILTIVYIHEE